LVGEGCSMAAPSRCTPAVKGCAKPEGLITKQATDFGFQVWLALKALGGVLILDDSRWDHSHCSEATFGSSRTISQSSGPGHEQASVSMLAWLSVKVVTKTTDLTKGGERWRRSSAESMLRTKLDSFVEQKQTCHHRIKFSAPFRFGDPSTSWG